MLRPPPPKPVPKPGHIKVVRALYKYTAQQADELSFDEGDMLYIIDMNTDPNWWKAKCGNNSGLVPSNYVADHTETVDNPLHEAAKRGNLTFLKECIQNKVSPNGLDKSGSTALHWAAHGGHIDCLALLLDVPNINIDVQNKLGDTPLHSAAWKGHADVVNLLLLKGARTDLCNKDDKTALDLATDPIVASALRTNVPPADEYEDTEDSD